MSGYLKCTDPNDPNKYILLSEGDISFYENIGGVPTLTTALTQINIYDIASGGSLIPGQRYRGTPDPPQVYIEPKKLRTFDYGGISMDQQIEIGDPTVSHSAATGKCQVSVSGGLRSVAGGVVAVAPLSGYRTNSDDDNPTWMVPVSGIAAATVYGYITNWMPGGDDVSKYGISYSFSAGIGSTSAGADYWGAGASGSFSDGATHLIQTSVSGTAGNYLYIRGTIASNGALFSAAGEAFDAVQRIKLVGAHCVAGNKILSSDDVYSAVIVGR